MIEDVFLAVFVRGWIFLVVVRRLEVVDAPDGQKAEVAQAPLFFISSPCSDPLFFSISFLFFIQIHPQFLGSKRPLPVWLLSLIYLGKALRGNWIPCRVHSFLFRVDVADMHVEEEGSIPDRYAIFLAM